MAREAANHITGVSEATGLVDHVAQGNPPPPHDPGLGTEYVDAPAHEELEEESTSALRKRASELDIAGRSSMDKDELIKAIEEHEQS